MCCKCLSVVQVFEEAAVGGMLFDKRHSTLLLPAGGFEFVFESIATRSKEQTFFASILTSS